ncbi:MAG: helix-turn-helix domain-containing protein [Acidobacteriota bacterium]
MPEDRTVGARLRRARDERGLSLRQIADVTKLPIRSLEALERDQVAQLPAGIYRRSIVRVFAREVGLDPEATLRAFLADHPDDLVPAAIEARDDRSANGGARLSGRVIFRILGGLVPVAAGVVYFTMFATSGVAPSAPVEASRAADEWRPEIVPAGGFREAPPPAARPVSMVITVTERCLLRVSADGRVVSARVMNAGEHLRVDMSREIVLSGDDAGAVQFSINGVAGRLLGARGAPLDARITRDDYDAFLIER